MAQQALEAPKSTSKTVSQASETTPRGLSLPHNRDLDEDLSSKLQPLAATMSYRIMVTPVHSSRRHWIPIEPVRPEFACPCPDIEIDDADIEWEEESQEESQFSCQFYAPF